MKDLRARRQSRPGLVESIKSGLAVPILSDEALLDLALPSHTALAQAYADYTGYTLDDRENLPRMARFYKLQRQRQAQAEGQDFTASDLRADFFDFVKNFIYAHAEAAGSDADLLAEAEAQYAASTVTKFASVLGYPRLDGGRGRPLAGVGQPALPGAADHQPLHLSGGGAGQGGQGPAHGRHPLAQGPARPDR